MTRNADADDEESPVKKTPNRKKGAKGTKEDEEDVKVKDEPNEVGELMDALAG